MKRRTLAWMLMLCVILLSSCTANTRGAVTPKQPSFSLETDGLVQVQTVHESDQTVKSYSLASGQRIMDAEPFMPDGMRVYTVDFLTFGMDNNMLKGPIRVYDEEKLEAPVTREIDAICRAMREVGHSVMECRILHAGEEWFASAMLNVNLWTPYRFYYFHQESGRLMLLYEFNGRDVTAVRILSADRLRALDQQSIGGWPRFTPDSLMEAHPDVLENTAQMLLRRGDLFDEAAVRGRDHSRKLTVDSYSGLPFGYVLNGVTYGYENVTYLNDNEKAVFQALLDLCPPYEIGQIPGTDETCTVLIFRFAAYDQETDRQEELMLFRLADAPESAAFARTVSELREQFGELIPCGMPGWMMLQKGPTSYAS